MSLLADLNVGPDVSLTDVEKKMSSGDLPPEGVHHAVLTQVGPIPNADGRGWKFTFEILAGAGKSTTVEETLWKPKGDSEKKDAVTRNRILLFGARLGLLKSVPTRDGKEKLVEVEGKHDFCDCLGATCFIEVQHEEREYEAKGAKKKVTDAKLTFAGLLAPDDKKCKDVPRGTGAAAAAVASGKATAKAADNLDGL